MNYIQLINRFWLLHEEHTFCTADIALFFYLLKINNQCNWKDTFRRNNSKACADLGISFNTLSNARKRLQAERVINFTSNAGSPDVTYNITLSKIDEVVVEVVCKVTTEVVHTKDKLKETKQNQTKVINKTPGTLVPVIEKIAGLQLVKPVQHETDFYQTFTAAWFDFYTTNFKHKPTFGALEGSKLKSIMRKLQSKSTEQNFEWTADTAKQSIGQFLTVAMSDKWLKENFTLPILDSKFDIIIVKALKNNYASSTSTAKNVFGNW